MSAGDLTGAVVGERYVLDSILGRGGVCEVWAGRDLRLERDVAVKVLRADVPVGHTLARRFAAEVRASASLNHPNIVTTFDVVEVDDRPYLILERLPGTTLADRLRSGPMESSAARELAADVLAALGEAHRAGLVHRDIKPTNLLEGWDGRWRVADFGIAKSLLAPPSDDTTTGVVVGTPAYLAPEQIRGGQATEATDLYSLSVVLYEMLAGRRPFSGDSAIALAKSICEDEPMPLDAIRPDLDSRLVALVGRGMAKDQARRFRSAEEMAAVLGQAPRAPSAPVGAPDAATIAFEPAAPDTQAVVGPATEVIPARQPPAPEDSPPPPRRYWVALAALAVGVLVGLAVLLSWGASTSGPATTATAGSTPSPHPTSTTPSTAPGTASLAPALDGALRRLESAVRR
jgi:serine/threonine-protein kinase